MARPKVKDSKQLNVKIDVRVLERLEAYCAETGLAKTVAIERILMKFFDEKESK